MATENKVKQRKVATPKTVAKPSKASNAKPSDKPRVGKKGAAPGTNDASAPDAPLKKSRKRAVDYFQGEEVESSEGKGEDKDEKPKKKAKTIPHSKEKPSKVDGHPIETEKTRPGGDMVEVEIEPTEVPKGKKNRSVEKGAKHALAEEDQSTKKSTTKAPKPKKAGKKIQSEPTNEELAGINDDLGETSEAVTTKPSRRTKKTKDAAKQSEPVASVHVEVLLGDTEVAHDAPTKEPSGDVVTAEKALPSKGRKAKKSLESEDASTAAVPKPKKGAKTDTVKSAKGSSAKAKASESPEISKKPEKPEQTNKTNADTKDGSNAQASKSRKRKAPADADIDSKSKNLVDQLAEPASTSKKAKKTAQGSKETIGHKVKDVLSSGMEAAAQGAYATKIYINDLANGVETSIMSDITEVASETVDVKKTSEKQSVRAKSSRKGKGKAKDEPVAPLDKSSKPLELGGPGDVNMDEDSPQVVNGMTDEDGEDGEVEEDDQTAALLKGFESSEDEDASGDEGFMAGKEIPNLPKAKETAKKIKGIKGKSSEPGVVYVGRIPHGFYEHEMRAYFSQFGPISRLRLSRNKSTGKSKHYAFIEFASTDVAKIVASTMNNYLMFGHILKCAVIPKEQVHDRLWIGANKRFKKIPRNKIEGRKLEMGMGRPGWGKRIEGEKKRRDAKMEKMKEIGYEFEGGELKSVDEVPVREAPKVIEDAANSDEFIEQEKTVVVEPGETGRTLIVSEEITTKVKNPRKNKSDTKVEESPSLLESAGASLESALITVVDTVAGAANAAEKAIIGDSEEKMIEPETNDNSEVAAVLEETANVAENVVDTLAAASGDAAETVAETVAPVAAAAAPKKKEKKEKAPRKTALKNAVPGASKVSKANKKPTATVSRKKTAK